MWLPYASSLPPSDECVEDIRDTEHEPQPEAPEKLYL
jgi:hypothetical protein